MAADAPRSLTGRALLVVLVMLLPLAGGPAATGQSGGGSDGYVQSVPDDTVLLPAEGAAPADRMRAVAPAGPVRTGIVTTTTTFPDALASGLLQADGVLLGASDGRLAAEDQALLGDVDEVVLLGGVNAVPDSVRQDLPDGVPVRRLSGAERTATAAAVAMDSGGTADTVLVVRARGPRDNPTAGFIDAIGAGVWSAATGWPVLLVDGDAVSVSTRAAMDAIDPDRVVVIGGTAAVSSATITDLADGRPVRRVAGPERFTTAALVAAEVRPGTAADVLLIDGGDPEGWATGFGAAGRLAEAGAVLLSNGEELPPATIDALGDLSPSQLRCAAPAAACLAARDAAGLMPVTALRGTPAAGEPLPSGQQVSIDADAAAELIDDGGCLEGGRRIGEPWEACTATWRVAATAGTVGQTVTLTWPAIRLDTTSLTAAPEYTIPQAGGRFDFDETIDARVGAATVNSLDSVVDPAASVLRYPSGGNVPVLWSGYRTSVLIPPDGLAVPVDSQRFTRLSARIWSPAGGGMTFEWRSCSTAPGTHCTTPDAIVAQGYGQLGLGPGWQTVSLDLSATPTWTGLPIHMVFVQAPEGARLDDLRITDGAAGDSVAAVVAPGASVVWDSNADPTDNTDPASAHWGVLPGGLLDSNVLPPGEYWLHATPAEDPTTAGQTIGPITIEPGGPTAPAGPVVTDWSVAVRGRPWDFASDATDYRELVNATPVDGPGLTAVNANRTGDPQVILDLPEAIDSTRFTHLALALTIDGPLDLSGAPGGGTVARVLFKHGGQWITGNDIIIYPGQTDYVVDMTAGDALEGAGPAWASAPVTALRIDPNEDPGSGRRWSLLSVSLTDGPPTEPAR